MRRLLPLAVSLVLAAASWNAAFTSIVMSAASTPCPITSAARSTPQSGRRARSSLCGGRAYRMGSDY